METVYNPKRTFVVNKVGSNFLVRGNLPLDDDGNFAYDDLAKRLKADKITLSKMTLIDVSLIDNQGEAPELSAEFKAFDETMPSVWPPVDKGFDIFKQFGSSVCGHPGKLMWMPIQGCADQNNCTVVENPQYNFAGIVDHLQMLIEAGSNTVIYFHCMNGHDRAGSLTACYMMKHMGRSRDQAMNQPPPGGAMAMKHDWKETYKPLIEWYAGTIGK
jgi:hypothetical protein